MDGLLSLHGTFALDFRTPGDFGSVATNNGCYRMMGGGIMTNPGIRSVKGGASGYESCPTPTSIDGYLYVNLRWPIYTSYEGPPVNLLRTFLGKEVGSFQFRKD
jgi:hypothetical protein